MADPLDDFLDREFSCKPNEALKNALREQTVRMLTRRRWARRLVLAGAAAACYLAGLATMWVLPAKTAANSPVQPAPVIVEMKDDKPAAPVTIAKPAEKAIDYEWRAHDFPAERTKWLQKAGDLYFAQQDFQGAVRCYGQALAASGPEALEFSSDDNWLVMALKRDRRKEKVQ